MTVQDVFGLPYWQVALIVTGVVVWFILAPILTKLAEWRELPDHTLYFRYNPQCQSENGLQHCAYCHHSTLVDEGLFNLDSPKRVVSCAKCKKKLFSVINDKARLRPG